jgi:enoyl-CoA hydratase/carnithine racemase
MLLFLFSCFMLFERFAPAAGTQRLPRLVGLPKALEMMLVWLTYPLQVAMHA